METCSSGILFAGLVPHLLFLSDEGRSRGTPADAEAKIQTFEASNRLSPSLGAERKRIQFPARLLPLRPMPGQQRDKPFAVRRLQQVQHLVHHHVLDQVLGLLHQFGIQADVAGRVVAAAPLGLHALQEIARNLHDEINPLLTLLKYNLTKHRIEVKKNKFDPDSLIKDEETLDKAIDGIRTTCLDLIPSFLLQNGLIPSLDDYIRSVQQIEGMTADFESSATPEKMETFDIQEQLNIYRVCLEILNNLFKHYSKKFLID